MIKVLNFIICEKPEISIDKNIFKFQCDFLSSKVIFLSTIVLKFKNLQNVDNQKNFISIIFKRKFCEIFSSLDDNIIIDYNLECLKQHTNTKKQKFVFSNLDVYIFFVKHLETISFDHKTILEWLVSNETEFLQYLVRYLKLVNLELNYYGLTNLKKLYSMYDKNYMVKAFLCLKSLRENIIKLEKVFPYNCRPLILILNKFIFLSSKYL